MIYTKLASQIFNDIYSGLRGYHNNMSISIEQLEDEIVEMRLAVIKEYQLKGILPLTDLYYAINCIPVDCKDLERCPCRTEDRTPTMHFEIPQILLDLGLLSVAYVGSIDRMNSFKVYISSHYLNVTQKYKRRGKNKPYVYIDPAPNEHNMLDCWVFNAPFLEFVSIVAIFKDPRELEGIGCCPTEDSAEVIDNMNLIDYEVKQRLTDLKIKYYRQLAAPIIPNNQTYM